LTLLKYPDKKRLTQRNLNTVIVTALIVLARFILVNVVNLLLLLTHKAIRLRYAENRLLRFKMNWKRQ